MALTFLMLIAVSAGVEIVICVISGGPGDGRATASAFEGATSYGHIHIYWQRNKGVSCEVSWKWPHLAGRWENGKWGENHLNRST